MEIVLYKKIFQIMQTANDDDDNEAVDDANDKKILIIKYCQSGSSNKDNIDQKCLACQVCLPATEWQQNIITIYKQLNIPSCIVFTSAGLEKGEQDAGEKPHALNFTSYHDHGLSRLAT